MFQADARLQPLNGHPLDLNAADRANLPKLVAELKPYSKDTQALAGVYLEAVGMIDEAALRNT